MGPEKPNTDLKPGIYPGAETNALLSWSVKVVERALEKAHWNGLGPGDGLIIATTTGLTRTWEGPLMDFFKTKKLSGSLYHPLGTFAEELQHQLNHNGPIQMLASACSAGSQALGLAKSWIQSGFVERCLVLGAEEICDLTSSGFQSLSLVNGEDCFPFNEAHNNICLSEGAAAITFDSQARGALAQLTGYGCASDAHSMTAPKPDGSGPMGAMLQALADANQSMERISWVHAHGTGSVQNDRAEAAALKENGLWRAGGLNKRGAWTQLGGCRGVRKCVVCLGVTKARNFTLGGQ